MRQFHLRAYASVLLAVLQGLYLRAYCMDGSALPAGPVRSKTHAWAAVSLTEPPFIMAIRTNPKILVTVRPADSQTHEGGAGHAAKHLVLGQISTNRDDAVAQLRNEIAESKKLDINDPDLARTISYYGYQLLLGGLYGDSENFLNEAIELRQKQGPAGQFGLGQSYSNLGLLYLEEGRLAEARPLIETALQLRQGDPQERFGVEITQIVYGKLLAAEGSRSEAEVQLHAAVESLSQNKVFPIKKYSGYEGPFGDRQMLTTRYGGDDIHQWLSGRIYYPVALFELANLLSR